MAKSKKIFVLDTSVILYDHNSFRSFQDNDIVIPITVIEELDTFKKGDDTKNFQAREFIRTLDKLSSKESILKWNKIESPATGKYKVYLKSENKEYNVKSVFSEYKNDHEILNTVLEVKKEFPDRKVILVTKDINFRLKARSLDIEAEDYETGKIKNVEKLYTGKSTIVSDEKIINLLYEKGSIGVHESGLSQDKIFANHYYILKDNKSSALAFFNPETNMIERLEKKSAYKITPRNSEQIFALHAILNPNVRLVTLQGVAGTGKTLLALAGAIDQKRNFRQIFLARPIIPLSNKDLGFLPGNISEKINPYMEPLWDNMKFIQSQYKEADKEYKFLTEAVQNEKIVITPLAFIRGRSISNVLFIVDEAQNLTPHEIKTIITRAGEGTKIVFTGDVNQIDTPYLDKESNGLSYLIDKIKDHPLCAHVKLEKGERSELANLANELL